MDSCPERGGFSPSSCPSLIPLRLKFSFFANQLFLNYAESFSHLHLIQAACHIAPSPHLYPTSPFKHPYLHDRGQRANVPSSPIPLPQSGLGPLWLLHRKTRCGIDSPMLKFSRQKPVMDPHPFALWSGSKAAKQTSALGQGVQLV